MRKKVVPIFIILFLITTSFLVWIISSRNKSTPNITNNTKPANNFSDFKKLMKDTDCADLTNALYSIDDKYVVRVREGNCPDNSYSTTLYGSTPDEILCNVSDSIEGPRTSCTDESSKQLFDIVTNHLNDKDLGLGPSHKVKKIQ